MSAKEDGMIEKSERMVLYYIVREYLNTFKPVGSVTLLKKYNIKYSSATIRNKMKKLMDEGYIYKPHSSAGRIPNDKGMRFYYEETRKADFIDKDSFLSTLSKVDSLEISKILDAVSKLTAVYTKSVCLIEYPNIDELLFKGIHLFPINDSKLIAVISTDLGVSHINIRNIDRDLYLNELQDSIKVFNERMMNLPIYKIKDILSSVHPDSKYIRKGEELFMLVKNEFENLTTDKHYLNGIENVIENPYIDLNRKLYRYISNPENIKSVIKSQNILIGMETGIESLKDLYFLRMPYKLRNIPVGNIYLAGYKYSDFAIITSVLNYIVNRLSEIITKIERGV
jgi:heat-inducible transcriptional repressor